MESVLDSRVTCASRLTCDKVQIGLETTELRVGNETQIAYLSLGVGGSVARPCSAQTSKPHSNANARSAQADGVQIPRESAPQPQYRFAFRSVLVTRSFPVRFGLGRVPTTRTVRGSPEHSRSSKARDLSQPISNTFRNSKSILWLDAFANLDVSREVPVSPRLLETIFEW